MESAEKLINKARNGRIGVVDIVINTGLCRELIKELVEDENALEHATNKTVYILGNYYTQICVAKPQLVEVDFLFGEMFALLQRMDLDNGSRLITKHELQRFAKAPAETFMELFEKIFDNSLFDQNIVNYYEADLERILQQLKGRGMKNEPVESIFFEAISLKSAELNESYM